MIFWLVSLDSLNFGISHLEKESWNLSVSNDANTYFVRLKMFWWFICFSKKCFQKQIFVETKALSLLICQFWQFSVLQLKNYFSEKFLPNYNYNRVGLGDSAVLLHWSSPQLTVKILLRCSRFTWSFTSDWGQCLVIRHVLTLHFTSSDVKLYPCQINVNKLWSSQWKSTV